jgi:hypothetical protein
MRVTVFGPSAPSRVRRQFLLRPLQRAEQISAVALPRIAGAMSTLKQLATLCVVKFLSVGLRMKLPAEPGTLGRFY